MSEQLKAQNAAWWKEAVFYQIYPRSFKDSNGDGVGDLRGVIEKLDYLKELGIDAVWMSPMYRSPMVDHGYDISDYEDIDPAFGTMEDFKEMLDGLHARDIKLMIDLVINHTSDQHPWFLESRSSLDNPKRDWYIWRDGKDGKEPNNWGAHFGGSAWELDEKTGQYYMHLFAPGQPDLNWRNPEVKEAVFDMIKRWTKRGIDGFRVDVGHFYLKDPAFPDMPPVEGATSPYVLPIPYVSNQPGIHELYQEMRAKALGPDQTLFGELYELDHESALLYAAYDRKEFDMVYQYPVVGAKGDWTQVRRSVREWAESFRGKAWNSLTFSNHDSARPVSVYGNDEVHRETSAKMIATYLLTAPGTPFLLQGEELGMTNVRYDTIDQYQDAETVGVFAERVAAGADPVETLAELAPWSRDNARTPVQWDDSEQAGFTTGTPWLSVNQNYQSINASAQRTNPDSVFSYYQTLIALRKQHPALVYGEYTLLTPDDWSLTVSVRTHESGTVLVLLNTANEPATISAELVTQISQHGTPGTLLLSNETESPQQITADLPPWGARVYVLE